MCEVSRLGRGRRVMGKFEGGCIYIHKRNGGVHYLNGIRGLGTD